MIYYLLPWQPMIYILLPWKLMIYMETGSLLRDVLDKWLVWGVMVTRLHYISSYFN